MALNEGEILAGKYRIERLLGEGGMGAVYVVTNTVLQKRVAMKVMSERFAAVPAAVERFLREAVAASRVSHPSIVQVFDAGEHEGAPWIAMEMLEGESLGERLERGPMSVQEVLDMADGVLSALAEVHDDGIIHRDLKPDNIFLARRRSGGWVPKVLDFGVAKDMSDGQLSKLTATGAVVGTAHYLSPEQAKGLPDIDARADVYAMGVVFFEALSGRMPYEAETITQLIAKMFTEAPMRLDQVAPGVPPPLVDVVSTCLEQDWDKRFQTARALLGAMHSAAQATAGGRSDVGMAATSLALSSSPGTAAGAPDLSSGGYGGQSQPGSYPGGSQPGSYPGGSQPGSYPGGSQPGSYPGGSSEPGAQRQPGSFPATAAGTPMPPSRGGTQALPSDAVPSVPTAAAQAAPAKSRVGLIALLLVVFGLGAAGTVGGALLLAGSEEETEPVAANEPESAASATQQAETTTPQAPTAPTEPEGSDPPARPPEAAGDEQPDEGDEAPEASATPVAHHHRRGHRRHASDRAAEEEHVDEPAQQEPQQEPQHEEEQPAAQTPPARPPAQPQAPARPARPANGLNQAQIMGAIRARLPYLESRCYQRRLRRVPDLAGVVTIAWTVGPDGTVQNAEVVHNGTGDEWLGRCTRNIVRDTHFPPAANGRPTPARFPFTFHPH